MVDRVVQALVECPELRPELLGERQVVGVVRRGPVESPCDGERRFVKQLVIMELDRLSDRGSQCGKDGDVVQATRSPRLVKRIGDFVAEEARCDKLVTVAAPSAPCVLDRIVGGNRYQPNDDARVNAEQRGVRHRALLSQY